MSKIIACTIIANNYFKYADLFARSYKKQHPDHEVVVLFVDNQPIQSEHFISMSVSDLKNIPDWRELSMKYTILEFSTAIKPFLLSHVIKKHKPKKIFYFDPDIYIYKKLNLLVDRLDSNDCVLVPHVTSPAKDTKSPDEWDYMKSGYYNLGFAGFAVNTNVKNFLHWWEEKLSKYCYSDPENFMFTDQKWMDFAPSYLRTSIIKEFGYDVAYWNLHQYIGSIMPEDIVFFHFSGFNHTKKIISKYQNRYTYKNVNEYLSFFTEYAKKLEKYDSSDKYQYPFNTFENGVSITPEIRLMYALWKKQKGAKTKNQKINPFSVDENSFYQYLLKPVQGKGKRSQLINFFNDFHTVQRQVSAHFPLTDVNNFTDYVFWTENYAQKEYKVPTVFVTAQKKLRKNEAKNQISTYSDNLIQQIEHLRKTEADNEKFVSRLYRIVLARSVDKVGFETNVAKLNIKNVSRSEIVYRLLTSKEAQFRHTFTFKQKMYIYSLIPRSFSPSFISKLSGSMSTNAIDKFEKSQTAEEKLGINIFGYFDTESGVGESARGLIKPLQKVFKTVRVNNIEQPWLRRNDKRFAKLFTNIHDQRINLFCVNADQTNSMIESTFTQDEIKNYYNIGYWYWESTVFPEEYLESFKYLDEIWVATDFIYNALRLISPVPVVKIPPSFSKPVASGNFNFKKYDIKIDTNDYVFLNLFDSASFWERKNPFGLISAFKKAFGSDSSKKLIIKTTKIKDSEIYPRLMKHIGTSTNIFLIDGYLSRSNIIKLIKTCDSYISLHKCEGLGIPLIEAMLLNKPIIATAYGGNLDFMNVNNSYLVKYKEIVLEENLGPYPKGTIWADADVEDAAEKMKLSFSNRKSSLNKKSLGTTSISTIQSLIEERSSVLSQRI